MCILHIVFCTVCKYVLSICKLFVVFLHCLSICKLLLLLFFCTVWSTVNAPVQVFLHCLSMCKLLLFFFALSGARS